MVFIMLTNSEKSGIYEETLRIVARKIERKDIGIRRKFIFELHNQIKRFKINPGTNGNGKNISFFVPGREQWITFQILEIEVQL